MYLIWGKMLKFAITDLLALCQNYRHMSNFTKIDHIWVLSVLFNKSVSFRVVLLHLWHGFFLMCTFWSVCSMTICKSEWETIDLPKGCWMLPEMSPLMSCSDYYCKVYTFAFVCATNVIIVYILIEIYYPWLFFIVG